MVSCTELAFYNNCISLTLATHLTLATQVKIIIIPVVIEKVTAVVTVMVVSDVNIPRHKANKHKNKRGDNHSS